MNSNKKIIFAWAFYDWANSVYPLVITTAIFPIYFAAATNEHVTLFGFEFINTELYSYVISLSFVIVCILSPILSGVADYSGKKKFFLKLFCYIGASCCASLFFFSESYLLLSMLAIMMTSVGFWSSLVFYNAYLPEIAPKEEQDKVSAKGFALGYLGSAILLIICLAMIMSQENGEDKVEMMRWSFVITAIWWAGFAQYTYRHLPSNVHNKQVSSEGMLTKGISQLKLVWNELKEQPNLRRYLLAFFVYSMGVQTVMLMATLFGMSEIEGMEDEGMIISMLIIQFVAIGGAFVFSFAASKIGNIKTLLVAVFLWIIVCIIAYLIHAPVEFYGLAILVGFIMGGIQSMSRSTYSKFLPKTENSASYFSFYDVTEKLAIVIGTLSFGIIVGLTGGMRNATIALGIFFIIGFFLLLKVKDQNTT